MLCTLLCTLPQLSMSTHSGNKEAHIEMAQPKEDDSQAGVYLLIKVDLSLVRLFYISWMQDMTFCNPQWQMLALNVLMYKNLQVRRSSSQ